jgi:peptidoglycan/xylan/chitin deacetylase (PgdA/CDA1 family)
MNTTTRKHIVTLLACLLLLEIVAVCSVMPAKTVDAFDTPDSNKMVALTFDDGPSEYTDRLLNILNDCDAKATFCVVGSKISANQNILQKALLQGCEIISHTWSHPDLTRLTETEVKQELLDTNIALYETLGITSKMFRPPFGETSPNVISAAKELDSAIILWSISTLDWHTQSTDATYDSIISNVHNGAIILCHDTVESTIDAIEQAIPALKAKGYTLVTISELLGETEPGQVYRNALNGWTGSTHTVQLGESLWSISKLYSTTIEAIKTLNGLTSDTILPGQVLAIPVGTPIVLPTIPSDFTGTFYTVQQGDTLWVISKKFDTTVDAIKALNGLTSDMIYVGQKLQITNIVVELNSIKITTLPSKVDYVVGDVLDLAGLTVTATYSNGETKTIADYTTNPANGAVLSDAGSQIIAVSYVKDGIIKSDTFTVEVKAKPVIQSLTCSYSTLIKQGNGNNGYGETTVTLAFKLSDGTTVEKHEPVSGIKWGINTVKEVTYIIGEQKVVATITIVPSGNNLGQLVISYITATYLIV